jgi:hypothetical protein
MNPDNNNEVAAKANKKQMSWKQYKRKGPSEMRPYIQGEVLPPCVSISEADLKNGSPKVGDMIARNPKNHDDQWLVAEKYYARLGLLVDFATDLYRDQIMPQNQAQSDSESLPSTQPPTTPQK